MYIMYMWILKFMNAFVGNLWRHAEQWSIFVEYSIPLPKWVVEEVEKDPDLAYTDQWGRRNCEYLSLGADTLPVLKGRTPVQCYADFMRAFRDNFNHLLGDTIVVILPSFLCTCLFVQRRYLGGKCGTIMAHVVAVNPTKKE